MIVRRGFRTAEPPRASVGLARWAPGTKGRNRMRVARRHRPRAPPGQCQTPEPDRIIRSGMAVPSVTNGGTGPRYGTGPAEAPLAQANQAPPENRLPNGVSHDYSPYICLHSMQGPSHPL
jgi:hypothetical protein